MECRDQQAYYPTLNYITVEKIKDFNVKATGVDKKLPHLNKKWIQTRRALGIKAIYFIFIKKIKAIYFILKRFYNEDCKVIDQDLDWVLITKGKAKSKELKERILDIELHRLGATEETWKLACKMLDHDHPGCSGKRQKMKDVSTYVIKIIAKERNISFEKIKKKGHIRSTNYSKEDKASLFRDHYLITKESSALAFRKAKGHEIIM